MGASEAKPSPPPPPPYFPAYPGIFHLKGQCHEIFCFWFFSWIIFPRAPEYSIKTISNFFENSRRYSQLKVCHRCRWHQWQMEKIFNQKNFNNFVRSPLGSRGNIYINFCHQVHRCLQPDIVPIICHRCQRHRWQICRRCRWYRWKICHRCRWHWWWTLICEYLREFSKKFEMILLLLSGDWGKVIHEKNLKQKSRDTVPLKTT